MRTAPTPATGSLVPVRSAPDARAGRSLRRVLAVLLAAALALVVVPPAQAATSSLTLTADRSPRMGESVWFSGKWSVGGTGRSGKSITLQYRKKGASSWKTAGSTVSRSKGAWAYRFRPDANYQYRALSKAWGSTPGASSPYINLTFSWSPRTIDRRVDVLGWRAGTSKGTKTVSVPGTTKVRYNSRSTMLLVEVTQSTKVRTWTVEGDIRDAYVSRGSARGELGVPLGDARCRLLDSGCLQRFSKGVVYDNAFKSPVVLLGTDYDWLEVLAVAKSQVGYAAPSNNISRYNDWVGTDYAWCSIFLSWVGAASGHSSSIATYGRFTDFHAWATSRYRKQSTPRVGAIAFFDTHTTDGRYAATHSGLVYGMSGSSIYVIEGNTTNPATGGGRGVYYKVRSKSQPMYYVYPSY
ncbi:CHAP domain-containing protein [Cellulomonas sp. DKR-3]|uniref:CHAP domain-containing protein n=1 Tax=Cellulomonas fulva TaxID=2835530 RepID=A0ABS5TZL8_9CELL|nr:CHAP domain-containing protein [Cellulomonas fulva]MBT0994603.1 CHAP domain-containing protein [Cellulomonas fulva]